ncbi:hypothetical protein PQX77_015279 [Marasmius sp. AFHP31]|nr:hypothetical protein PQX77_015279 [Marasmius sp. AFHP31]
MDSTSLAIATTSSQLMHASLAYLSLEIRTLDAIIARPPPRHHSIILPTEILLSIRSRLLTSLTSYLIHQSHSALQRYESRLLCTECRSYNDHIYGDDPWVWDPCGCLPPTTKTKFIDRREWLENYLSKKSLRFVKGKGEPRSHHPIWRVVGDVLHGFQCTSVRVHRHRSWLVSFTLTGVGIEGNGNDADTDVLIVPDPGVGVLLDDKLRLRRVERELALTVTVKGPCVEALSVPSPGPMIMRRRSPPGVYSPVSDLFPVLCSVIISIPLSVVTVLLKVVCWYCKPGAFKCVLL